MSCWGAGASSDWLGKPVLCIFPVLGWRHLLVSLKSAIVEAFTPREPADTTSHGSCCPAVELAPAHHCLCHVLKKNILALG